MSSIFQSISNALRKTKYYKQSVDEALQGSKKLAKTTPDKHLENPIMVIQKGINMRLSRHFSSKEFDCKCSYPDCKYTLIDRRVVLSLEELRREVNRPIRINSAYRCEKHNADIGGHKNSKHKLGLAVDIPTVGSEGMKKAINEGLKKRFPFILIYPSKRNFTHADFREAPAPEIPEAWSHDAYANKPPKEYMKSQRR